MRKQTVGVDLGEKNLKLVVRTNGKISKVIMEPMPENYIQNGKVVSMDAMSEFLKSIVKQHRLKGSDCALLLSYEDALLRRTTVPSMSRSQMELNLPYEFRVFIKDGMDRYFYDYMTLEKRTAEDGSQEELDIVAAATKKETIETYREMLRKAGLKLKIAIPRECAYSNLLRHCVQNGDDTEEDYCFVDLGHQNTRVHIFSGVGFEVTRIIDSGGMAMDWAIARELELERDQACAYKESNQDNVQNSESCREVYHTIALEIMKAINFYRFNKSKSNIRQIYFCGGGGKIEPLLKSIEQATELPVKSISELFSSEGMAEELLMTGAIAAGSTMQ